MLNIVFGRHNVPKDGKLILNSVTYFTLKKKSYWFEDDLIKRALMGVEGTEVLFQEALKDKLGRGISTEQMSTGCKTLCLLYYDEDGFYYNGSLMGDNCVPYLLEIGSLKNINIFLDHFMDIPDDVVEQGEISINGVVTSGKYDYEDAFIDYSEEIRKMSDDLHKRQGVW